MSIFFIRPPISGEKTYPLELARLVTSVSFTNQEVCCYDFAINYKQSLQGLLKKISDNDIVYFTTTVVGISRYPDDISKLYRVINLICKSCNATIVVGGDYCTINSKIFFENKNIDYLLQGDVEYIFPELVRYIMNSSEPFPTGCISKSNKDYQTEAFFSEQLVNLPMANFTSFDLENYPKTIFSKGKLCFPVITSRGCPEHCCFCNVAFTSGKNHRKRSICSVLEEMTFVKENYSNVHFLVEDDNFAFDSYHLENFCTEIVNRKLSITWECINGIPVESLVIKQVKMLAESGCIHIAFGIEVLDEKLSKELGRKLKLDYIYQVLDACEKFSIYTTAYYILNPPETSFLKKLQLFFMTFQYPVTLSHYSIFIIQGRPKLWHIFFQKSAYLLYYLWPPKIIELARFGIFNSCNNYTKIFKKIIRIA